MIVVNDRAVIVDVEIDGDKRYWLMSDGAETNHDGR
jgi:hypothetical protein